MLCDRYTNILYNTCCKYDGKIPEKPYELGIIVMEYSYSCVGVVEITEIKCLVILRYIFGS